MKKKIMVDLEEVDTMEGLPTNLHTLEVVDLHLYQDIKNVMQSSMCQKVFNIQETLFITAGLCFISQK